MKKSMIIFLFSAMAVLTYAQDLEKLIEYNKSATIEEGAQIMRNGSQNAFSMKIKHTDNQSVEKSWEKYLKQFKGKTKKDKKSGEYFSDNSNIEQISNNTIDVYSVVRETGKEAEILVWFDLGGAYLNTEMHPERVPQAEKMLQNFSTSFSAGLIVAQLSMEEDKLDKINKEYSSLQKEKEKLEEEITKCEQKIEEANKKIEENMQMQTKKMEEVKMQEGAINKVKVIQSGIR